MKNNKNFLSLFDVSADEIYHLIRRGIEFKKKKEKIRRVFEGKILGLIFEKESTRTRISFEVAMARLGGSTIYMGQNASQLSRGETYSDTAKVISRYLDALVLRTSSQNYLKEMADSASIPIINGLTDEHHPCQLLADLMTILERSKDISSLKIAYIGDGNNMANSWIVASYILGFQLTLACPKGYWPMDSLLKDLAKYPQVQITDLPEKAISGCDVINTDTWFSMGQEVSDKKRSAFKPFQVNQGLIQKASDKAIVLHCLPAHRGEEITDEVLDGPRSVVLDQAENRLYAQMALLEFLIKA